MGKEWSVFVAWGSGFLEIEIINFTSPLLFDADLNMLYHLLFFIYAFSLFHCKKSFLTILFY